MAETEQRNRKEDEKENEKKELKQKEGTKKRNSSRVKWLNLFSTKTKSESKGDE